MAEPDAGFYKESTTTEELTMATILTITSIGLYCAVCLFFFAMVRAAGWADRTEERKHSDDLARIRRHRRALVESAGRHRRHRAMANGPAGW